MAIPFQPPPSSAPAPSVAEVPAKPETPPASPPVTILRPRTATQEELLRQAGEASGTTRIELYAKVLSIDPRNAEALRGAVESSMASLPKEGRQRDDLIHWAQELVELNDPAGSHAIGCIDLRRAEEAHNILGSIKSLSDGITDLQHSLHAGYSASFFPLVQGYIDLHNARLQNREKPKADRASKALFDEIDRMPQAITGETAREHAEDLEKTLKDRASKTPPRMQEAFLRAVMQHLYATAAKRGDSKAQAWLKGHH